MDAVAAVDDGDQERARGLLLLGGVHLERGVEVVGPRAPGAHEEHGLALSVETVHDGLITQPGPAGVPPRTLPTAPRRSATTQWANCVASHCGVTQINAAYLPSRTFRGDASASSRPATSRRRGSRMGDRVGRSPESRGGEEERRSRLAGDLGRPRTSRRVRGIRHHRRRVSLQPAAPLARCSMPRRSVREMEDARRPQPDRCRVR